MARCDNFLSTDIIDTDSDVALNQDRWPLETVTPVMTMDT